MDKIIYMDNAATTSTGRAALDAMIPVLEKDYGNPSSLHQLGQQAADLLADARKRIASSIGAQPDEIYFTSGGTEADNWAITQIARAGAEKGKKHIISTAFEHHAVLHTLKRLEKSGFTVTLLDVHKDGIVRVDELKAAIRPDTCLVTVMYANNEIGTIQPIAEIGAVCREHGIPFHTDAVQAAGHLPIDVQKENIDLLSMSAHKFHGPKGIGALYCRRGIRLTNFIEGGAQERGKRGGTENLPAICGMAAALEDACKGMDERAKRVSGMRDRIIDGIVQNIPHVLVNGDREKRLPGNVNICFEGIEGESLLLRLDLEGICASSGSACTSGSLDPSHVLLAIGLPKEVAHGSLRLTLDEENTEQEVDYLLKVLPGIVSGLRDMSPVWEEMMAAEK
ncbi:MAG TPA: cysteine desulfurase NifS [Candidatus Faecivivens stercoripullorum]|uniref:Cysteine desulfurase IscS n=1 Tax=Candidatus Faecivivens stercoripullorum TaxID=2840805 RepID=A0A9D1H4Q5_9FIRM|nr:cysteine desulfurase NifS [Candidatus Faecivivens stercoripullorum]